MKLATWVGVVLLSGVGCQGPGPRVSPTTVSVVDSLGRTVQLGSPARRVLSLAPGNTELAFALGVGDRLVGRTSACDHPAAAARVPDVGNLFPPDYERLVASRPDLALMVDGNLEVRRHLRDRGVPVFVYQPRTLKAARSDIRRLGRLLGAGAAADRLVARISGRLEAIAARLPASRPRVFYEVWPEPLTTTGPGTFLGDVIRLAGGVNLVQDRGVDWPQLSLERLVVGDPDVVVTAHRSTTDQPQTRAGWSSLRAVREGRVIRPPDPDLLVRPGPRVVEGIAWLAAALHPEAFPR